MLFNAVPPLEVVYHFMPVPVAVRFPTIEPGQRVCVAEPVGAAGPVKVTVTANLFELSQLPKVCDA